MAAGPATGTNNATGAAAKSSIEPPIELTRIPGDGRLTIRGDGRRARSECVVHVEDVHVVEEIERLDHRLEPLASTDTNDRDTRRSNDDVAGCRALLRPTPAGRSLTVVSLLRSLPVTGLKGTPVAYAKT